MVFLWILTGRLPYNLLMSIMLRPLNTLITCPHIFKLKCNMVLFMALLLKPPFSCHISPFLTRDKPNSDKRRVILDLSFPSGHSVKCGVPKDKCLGSYFDLKYPSVDHIVHSLKELGADALLYKIYISQAFRHLRIDPGDIDLLGLKHDSYYLDGNLPFGFRHGSVFFQCCSDAIWFIMADTFGYPNLYNYIDDLVYTGLPGEIQQSYQTLLALLKELGLEISHSKLNNGHMSWYRN